MSTNFPTSLDSYVTLQDNIDDVMASHQNDRGDAIEAVEAKVGIDGSAVQTSHDWKLAHEGIVQKINAEPGDTVDCTTPIPLDDTIPQITEGNEVLALSITPKSADNKLQIDVFLNVGINNTGTPVAALFQDSTANALAGGWGTTIAINYVTQIHFRHFMTAGTTSTTTFKVRLGPAVGGMTVTLNGVATARRLGGVSASSITITEIKV